jgi:hypothetical protein
MMEGGCRPVQKAQLFAKGALTGWLGEDGSQWCVVTRQDPVVTVEPYVYDGVLYYGTRPTHLGTCRSVTATIT